MLENHEENKDAWRKKENHIRRIIIGVIIAAIFLIIVLIFFRTQIWAIITGIAVIVGLIVDLITLRNTKNGG